jgi:Fe-S-cluster-containing hydrogenase component 2
MIHLEFVDRASTTQTGPVVLHASRRSGVRAGCPADASKQDENGIVHSSMKSRCIGCANYVLACRFAVHIMWLLQNGTQERNRIQKFLEDANVKIGNVLSDVVRNVGTSDAGSAAGK